ncbi:MAG: Hsp20/alpha crystallin family protein [Methanobacterium sp.]|nr:Hsp20/alpha crystallin family protein [Methanobacterium sp.]
MADNKEMEDKAEDVRGTTTLEKKEAEENVEEVEESIEEEKSEEGVNKGRTQAEKMFNDFISTVRNRQEDFSKAISDYTSNLEKPLADVIETETEIIIKTDLPGIEKKDISVNLTQDSVEILATFEEEFNEEEVDYIRRERNYGETRKVIQLPAKVKVKDVTAKFEDSILTINLPKVEAEKIEVDIN